MEHLIKEHNLVLVSASPSLEMAQQKNLPYLLSPKQVSPNLTNILEEGHSPLEHIISEEKVVYEPGTDPLCAVGTTDCLEEFCQEAKHFTELWETNIQALRDLDPGNSNLYKASGRRAASAMAWHNYLKNKFCWHLLPELLWLLPL